MSGNQSSFSFDGYLSIGKAAEILSVTNETLRNWDRSGKLKPVRHPVNGYRLYKRADLEALIGQITQPQSLQPLPEKP
ncbi:MerR family transcriptional regulator [Oxalobacteraceae bacterium R-40]|uniref:MerR family transcriptional regulator n=1 Tax=Keguizhuia sedimenti TaxID=3064264 RepID=A0ABU1BTP8_9BURK|nr:MerR family transcriptional regulator [Oxalobacteraceae bacterium R-40]